MNHIIWQILGGIVGLLLGAACIPICNFLKDRRTKPTMDDFHRIMEEATERNLQYERDLKARLQRSREEA